MARPHIAALIEDTWNTRLSDAMRRHGWRTKIIAHTGYGSEEAVRVLGRVLMTRDPARAAAGDAGASVLELHNAEDETRGWRAFLTVPAADVPANVVVSGMATTTATDRSGLIDVTIRRHGLAPGWHTVRLSSPDAFDVEASVLVVGADQDFGVVSDIDDTVLSTSLPRPMIAAWNTFFRPEGTRRPIPGMATFYRELAQAHPGMPFVYLSTGAWNLAPGLTRFLRRNGYPAGPLLLTDWGPTQTGWFRSGADHKRSSLHRLVRELPHVTWLLVGDDGQRDPKIYSEFAKRRPRSVRGIAIRELSSGQQVLSHGIPVGTDQLTVAPTQDVPVPIVRGPDGFSIARAVRPALGG